MTRKLLLLILIARLIVIFKSIIHNRKSSLIFLAESLQYGCGAGSAAVCQCQYTLPNKSSYLPLCPVIVCILSGQVVRDASGGKMIVTMITILVWNKVE